MRRLDFLRVVDATRTTFDAHARGGLLPFDDLRRDEDGGRHSYSLHDCANWIAAARLARASGYLGVTWARAAEITRGASKAIHVPGADRPWRRPDQHIALGIYRSPLGDAPQHIAGEMIFAGPLPSIATEAARTAERSVDWIETPDGKFPTAPPDVLACLASADLSSCYHIAALRASELGIGAASDLADTPWWEKAA